MSLLAKYGPVLAIVVSVTVLRAEDVVPAPVTRTNAQMLVEASRIEEQMKVDYRELLNLQESARKEKDAIRLNCVNARLVEVKAHMNLADSSSQELKAAIDRNSDDRNELFTKLSANYESILRLRDEARACVGAAEMYRQESGVDVTVPDLPDDPTATDPFQPDIEPPAYASPFY
jgi:hypothetical protein